VNRSPSLLAARTVTWSGLLLNRLDRLLAATFPGRHPLPVDQARPSGV
jgi:hypothetical protein